MARLRSCMRFRSRPLIFSRRWYISSSVTCFFSLNLLLSLSLLLPTDLPPPERRCSPALIFWRCCSPPCVDEDTEEPTWWWWWWWSGWWSRRNMPSMSGEEALLLGLESEFILWVRFRGCWVGGRCCFLPLSRSLSLTLSLSLSLSHFLSRSLLMSLCLCVCLCVSRSRWSLESPGVVLKSSCPALLSVCSHR